MVKYCCVKGCHNKNSEFSMHRFPKKEMLFLQWIERIGRTDLLVKSTEQVCNSYRVCSAHFEPESANTGHLRKSTLKRDAVPTLCLPPPTPQTEVTFKSDTELVASTSAYTTSSTGINVGDDMKIAINTLLDITSGISLGSDVEIATKISTDPTSDVMHLTDTEMVRLSEAMTAAKERTFILIKPDGVQRGIVGEVIERFEKKGFKLLALKIVWASKDLLKEHYAELVGKPFFPFIMNYMNSGPVVPMVWEGLDVVKISRQMLGATNPAESASGTIRGDLCIHVGRNIIHGSDAVETANREIALWFTENELIQWKQASESWIYDYNLFCY